MEEEKYFLGLLDENLKTPYYAVDEQKLVSNLTSLQTLENLTGCRVLLAQKAFSMFYFYPLIGQYLHGTTASGLFEARLGFEEMHKENHIFSPAYIPAEFDEIAEICDHIIFNSFSQWKRFRSTCLKAGKKCGIRINPACSTQEHAVYDPCARGSRLGVTHERFEENELEGISGLHFHTLCEQNVDALIHTLETFEKNFGKYLYQMEWLNIGGGHHITREDYDFSLLVETLIRLRTTYDIQIYIEPGEAVALNTGFLVSEVVDVIENDGAIAILNVSAACHMPDVLEMPYRPEIAGAAKSGEKKYTYRLGGPTCLAGDIIGEYAFDHAIEIGEKLIFKDMAHYSMVKNNTFNGTPLPAIVAVDREGRHKVVREFDYRDFKGRLS